MFELKLICVTLVIVLVLSNETNLTANGLSIVSPKNGMKRANQDQITTISNLKPPFEQNQSTSLSTSSIRIRSTYEDDLPTIIDLLAAESISHGAKPKQTRPTTRTLSGNWISSLKKLKSEASLKSQLTNRLFALNHARKIQSNPMIVPLDMDNDQLNYALWSDDTFRRNVENAVRQTSACEETIWDDWNFAITPDRKMLHHFMLSATDNEFANQVVGFCEVGMCAIPEEISIDGLDRDENTHNIIPCIGNLIVSPNHRKRGVGRKLIKSVIRLLKTYEEQIYGDPQKTSECLLGLFVDKDNVYALHLYEKVGFKIAGTCSQKGSERIFMIYHTSPSNIHERIHQKESLFDISVAKM